MAGMGNGYGSEFHLLRFLGRHRKDFDTLVNQTTGARLVDWLDYPFKPTKPWDREWKCLDFLPECSESRVRWKEFWPTGGNAHNWDAVGRILVEDRWEWLMVEAKSNIGELKSDCGAKEGNGLPKIRKELNRTNSD